MAIPNDLSHWIGFVGKIYRKLWFLPSNIRKLWFFTIKYGSFRFQFSQQNRSKDFHQLGPRNLNGSLHRSTSQHPLLPMRQLQREDGGVFGGLQPQHVEGTSGDPRGFWVNLGKPSWFSNLNQGHWSSLWPAPRKKGPPELRPFTILGYPHHHLTWGREIVITFTQQFDAWELGFCAPTIFGCYDNWDI